jgi:hypothetical protein
MGQDEGCQAKHRKRATEDDPPAPAQAQELLRKAGEDRQREMWHCEAHIRYVIAG